MSAYIQDIEETEGISFLIKINELIENTTKFGKTFKIVSKENLIVNQYTMKNI